MSSSERQITGDQTTEIPFPDRIANLVQVFSADIAKYRDKSFKEMSLRSEFLNPLLEELGWDPVNRSGSRFSDRDVVQEASVLIEGQQKAPDYAMQSGGQRKFFLEAKRPSVNISEGRSAAFQIRRYCWSAGLPYGIVTDFEEFAIYDCRAMPLPDDSASVGRIDYFQYTELPQKWSALFEVFGKESVVDGSLDRKAADNPLPRGTRAIDDAFLEDIRTWRSTLSRDIAGRNSELDIIDLGSATQRLIDRIVFLRIAEARGLEPLDSLKYAADSNKPTYEALLDLFRRADDRYNSGLFEVESDSSLEVSDDALSTVIDRMYFPHPYEFTVIPADILGRIYEQFLGETLVLDEGREVRVDQKPEVRRAGGVYYTPQPIVEYIVESTVQPILDGKRPEALSKVRIVDPACGSGSFLIAVFQRLIDWHRHYYSSRPRLAERYLEIGQDGQPRLCTAERKRILLNSVFGVDIDPSAVEVAKLSLLLKVIEGQNQMELEIGRILPDLQNNIKCGNSLIDTDYPQALDLPRLEQLKINRFNWQASFPSVFAAGGFDAVVGNPPYLNIDVVWGSRDPRLQYIKSKYRTVYSDKSDILFYFLARAIGICSGEVGFIVSRSFLEADKARKLRGWIADSVRVREVLDFRHALVFPKVGINTAIIRLTRSKAVKSTVFGQLSGQALPVGYDSSTIAHEGTFNRVRVPTARLGAESWLYGDTNVEAVVKKLDAAGTPVGEILFSGKGMETGSNKAFVFDAPIARIKELQEQGLIIERARNSDIRKYLIRPSGIWLLYVEDVRSFDDLPADVADHLERFESVLKNRAAFKRGNCDWWRYTWPLHRERIGRSRIFCPYRASENRFALDDGAVRLGITDTTVLYDSGQPEDLRYITGVLNSQLLTARFRLIGKLLGGGVLEYYESTVRRLPIPRRDTGTVEHDKMVELVTRRMEAAEEVGSTKIVAEQRELEEEMRSIDKQIDALVVELFGITDDEAATLYELLRAP